MNYAKLETSTRLQQTFRVLWDSGWTGLTTAEIQAATHSQAVHTDVSEMRNNGVPVECRYAGRTGEGRRIYRYTILCSRYDLPVAAQKILRGRGGND